MCPIPNSVPIIPYRFFFFNDTATTEIYTLSLHDALPISNCVITGPVSIWTTRTWWPKSSSVRSEEHTSELQSHSDLVCRLLLEKKNSEMRWDRLKKAATAPAIGRTCRPS